MNTDIQKFLQEIKAATGWSQPRIAREIGASQPTVNRLLKGQGECRSSTWQAIVDLRERLKSKPLTPDDISEAEAARNGGIRMSGDERDVKNIGE